MYADSLELGVCAHCWEADRAHSEVFMAGDSTGEHSTGKLEAEGEVEWGDGNGFGVGW